MIRVHVTRRDIRVGSRFNDYRCPIANAISRAIGGMFTVVVRNERRIVIRDAKNKKTLCVVDTPENVRKFIRDFDDYGDGEPFAFDFDETAIPPEYREYLPEPDGICERIAKLLGFRK